MPSDEMLGKSLPWMEDLSIASVDGQEALFFNHEKTNHCPGQGPDIGPQASFLQGLQILI